MEPAPRLRFVDKLLLKPCAMTEFGRIEALAPSLLLLDVSRVMFKAPVDVVPPPLIVDELFIFADAWVAET